jgi:hypothetical protein
VRPVRRRPGVRRAARLPAPPARPDRAQIPDTVPDTVPISATFALGEADLEAVAGHPGAEALAAKELTVERAYSGRRRLLAGDDEVAGELAGLLADRLPRFLYFDGYSVLPGRVSIPRLQAMEPEPRADRGAGLDFRDTGQNRTGGPPYLDVRIRNHRHRVTANFGERSGGLVWFFSFVAAFSELRDADGLVLLLDEPGLGLHAAGQADLRRYLDEQLAGWRGSGGPAHPARGRRPRPGLPGGDERLPARAGRRGLDPAWRVLPTGGLGGLPLLSALLRAALEAAVLLEVGAGHPAVRALAGEGSIVRRVERATGTALDRYRPARYLLAQQQRLLPAIGREPLHRFARLFATLDEL